MKFMTFKDEKGNPSYTSTMVIVGFFIINLKLLFSGIQITETIKLSEFSGVDYAAAIAAIGGIHLWSNKIKQAIVDNQDK